MNHFVEFCTRHARSIEPHHGLTAADSQNVSTQAAAYDYAWYSPKEVAGLGRPELANVILNEENAEWLALLSVLEELVKLDQVTSRDVHLLELGGNGLKRYLESRRSVCAGVDFEELHRVTDAPNADRHCARCKAGKEERSVAARIHEL